MKKNLSTMHIPQIDLSTIVLKNERVRPIIFVIDTSAAMTGDPIMAVNQGLQSFVQQMKSWEHSQEIGLAILSVSDHAEWLTDGLEKIDTFCCPALSANGSFCFGEALKELNARIRRKELLFGYSYSAIVAPVIIFILRHFISDDCKESAEALNYNESFWNAHKICIKYDSCIYDDELRRLSITNKIIITAVWTPNELKDVLGMLQTSIRTPDEMEDILDMLQTSYDWPRIRIDHHDKQPDEGPSMNFPTWPE